MAGERCILILEDNDERIDAFQRAFASFGNGWQLRIWTDAPSMCAEAARFFDRAALISLDHDLAPRPGAIVDPGTGLDVAQWLADFLPVCPVLIHSSNTDRAWSMHNELRFANWVVDRIGPIGEKWIETSWGRTVIRLISEHSNTWKQMLPGDHQARMWRARCSLEGLGLGDALGEMMCTSPERAPRRIGEGDLPPPPWLHTDDTEMAISIVEVLNSHGFIDQEALSRRFTRRFERDPERGYGKMTRIQLREISAGAKWRIVAAGAFGGSGSKGNGAAMRVAPLGAYFADDLNQCVLAAVASAEVTHTHREGIAGAVAVAIGAAMAWRLRYSPPETRAEALLDEVILRTPASEVSRSLLRARSFGAESTPREVAEVIGNGSLVTAPDTVPFCIWLAAHRLGQFPSAIADAIAVGGDCDTNAAIVGGIVALNAHANPIPEGWMLNREVIAIASMI